MQPNLPKKPTPPTRLEPRQAAVDFLAEQAALVNPRKAAFDRLRLTPEHAMNVAAVPPLATDAVERYAHEGVAASLPIEAAFNVDPVTGESVVRTHGSAEAPLSAEARGPEFSVEAPETPKRIPTGEDVQES